MAPSFHERFVGEATPRSIALIRILVCTVALAQVVSADLASLAALPAELRSRMGVLTAFELLPIGFERLLQSHAGLRALQAATAVLLALGAAGLFTRVVLPLALLGTLVIGGILRMYAKYYHHGLVSLYLLAVLSCAPCADALSLDALRRRRAGRPAPEPNRAAAAYGWARYACWITIALPYVLAGLTKLVRGGLGWWDPLNLKHHLLWADTRTGFGLAILLHETAPEWLFGVIGVATIVLELGFVAVLFSRSARWALPPLMALLHVGIVLLQGIWFTENVFLLLAFYDLGARGAAGPARSARVGAAGRVPRVGPQRALACLAALGLVAVWSLRRDYYPLTYWPMFSARDVSGLVRGVRVLAERASGEVFEPDIGRFVPWSAAVGHREWLRRAFRDDDWRVGRAFLGFLADALSRNEPPGRQVVRLFVEQREWDFVAEPAGPESGAVVARYVYEARPGNRSEPARGRRDGNASPANSEAAQP